MSREPARLCDAGDRSIPQPDFAPERFHPDPVAPTMTAPAERHSVRPEPARAPCWLVMHFAGRRPPATYARSGLEPLHEAIRPERLAEPLALARLVPLLERRLATEPRLTALQWRPLQRPSLGAPPRTAASGTESASEGSPAPPAPSVASFSCGPQRRRRRWSDSDRGRASSPAGPRGSVFPWLYHMVVGHWLQGPCARCGQRLLSMCRKRRTSEGNVRD